MSLQSLWHCGPILGGKADRSYSGVTAFAELSLPAEEERALAVPKGLPRAPSRGRKIRQSSAQSRKPAGSSEASGEAERLGDAGSVGEPSKPKEEDNSRRGVEGKDGTQTKRALKAVLGAYQRRGRRHLQEVDELREEDEESGGTEDSEEEEAAQGVAFGRLRKPRKRLLSEEDWELRRAYVATKLGKSAVHPIWFRSVLYNVDVKRMFTRYFPLSSFY